MTDNRRQKPPIRSPEGLKLLITVVDPAKAEFYADLIQSFSSNLQLFAAAEGTARTEALGMMGLSGREKAVIMSVVRADRSAEILAKLMEKFRTIRNGRGIAFTVPMTGTIGVLCYRFLADRREALI